ncbi:MAG TPA: hypothetical protein VGE21_09155, partial [Flavobacteriales bacterium]
LRCLLLALPVVVGTAAYVYAQRRYLPAPRITTNFAVNQKLVLAREAAAHGVDVLALGSSMTLNNLASSEVVKHFRTERFLNLGAWGIGASEAALLGPLLVDRLHPRTVIVGTNLMDFAGAPLLNSTDSAAIVRTLDTQEPWLEHLRHWNGPHYLRQIEGNRKRFSDAANYEYFKLDPYGGVTLDVPEDRIDHTRYAKLPPAATELQEDRYAAFERLAKDLKARGIQLIVLQNAYRDGIRTRESDGLQARHVARLRALLTPLGHVLVDANTRHWPDALYVDSSHLGPKGAQEFTAFCMEQLRVMGVPVAQ